MNKSCWKVFAIQHTGIGKSHLKQIFFAFSAYGMHVQVVLCRSCLSGQYFCRIFIFWRAGLHLLLDVSFCLFSRAETCLELFPQRLFRKSDKTNATSPIGTMGGDGSSLLQWLWSTMFQKSHENMCFCCCLSHWDTFSFMQPANHSHDPGIISQKTLSRALIYFCRLTAFPHNSYLCLRTTLKVQR